MYTMTMTLAFDEDAVASFEITSDYVFDPGTEKPKDIGLSVRLLEVSREDYDLPLAFALAKLALEQLVRPKEGR
jgi:hypothetical protein